MFFWPLRTLFFFVPGTEPFGHFAESLGSGPVFGNVMVHCRAANHHLFYLFYLEAITAMPTIGMAVIG